MPTVLVVQPAADDGLGRFSDWLDEHGIDIRTIRPYAGDAVPDRLRADALIVLGGDMSCNDTARFPWLEQIRALFRDAVLQHRPTLGICLGGQLLAQSLGGTVAKGKHGTEAGVVTVQTTDAAAGDALFDGLGPEFQVASMHGDAIEQLPDGAALLATSNPYPRQAFRAAPNSWGVQFHPEITPATYAQWAGEFRSSDENESQRVGRGVDDLLAADTAVRATAQLLATRFAALVTSPGTGRA